MKKKIQEVRRKGKEGYRKKRKVKDAEVGIDEIVFHAFANFLFGLSSGLVIAAMVLGNMWIIIGVYFLHKKNEVKTIPRMQYKSKFGKEWLYPIPSTLGFLCSYLIAEYINNWA